MLLENQLTEYENEIMTNYENQVNENNNNNNNNNNSEIVNDIVNEIKRTPIQDFYAGQNIFITGGTGFLGKILIEKLLRSCPDLSTIYLLIRPKKNKNNIVDRLEDIFNEPIFNDLKESSPKFRHKVVGMSGDCTLPGLGLSEIDLKILIEEVTIVFNCAATVRFDEPLKTAVEINAGGTLTVVNLCKKIKNLKVMIHVSTAFANSHLDVIDEKIYPHPYKYNQLANITNCLSEEDVNKILPSILGPWPNTYTFTKALAEQIIKEECGDLTVGILRPAIIISCAEEPLPGWTDNYYGPTGIAAAAVIGILKNVHINKHAKAHMIPVDYTVNTLLSCAWDVYNQYNDKTINNNNIIIYNYVSGVEAPVTWGFYIENCLKYGREFPLMKSIWYLTMNCFGNKFNYFIANILFHIIPALLLDLLSILTGNKPKIIKSFNKIQKLLNVTKPFCHNDWTFHNNNVIKLWNNLNSKDQLLFHFSFKNFQWKSYLRNYMLGIRIYLFKEDYSNLQAAKTKLKRLRFVHEGLKIIMLLLLFTFLWKMYQLFINI